MNRQSKLEVNRRSVCPGIRFLNEVQDGFQSPTTAESYVETENTWAGAKATDHGSFHKSSSAEVGVAAIVEGDHAVYTTTAGASVDIGIIGGASVDAEADISLYTYHDDVAKIEVGKGYVGAGAGIGLGVGGAKAKVEIGVDLVDMHVKFPTNVEMYASLGLNGDTGIEVGVDGVKVSAFGFGLKVRSGIAGISTPLGKVGLKLPFW